MRKIRKELVLEWLKKIEEYKRMIELELSYLEQ